MEASRKRQVKTTRLRHPKLYEENGKRPHPRGFSDPEVARKAALKGHEMRRLKKLKEQEKLNASSGNDQED